MNRVESGFACGPPAADFAVLRIGGIYEGLYLRMRALASLYGVYNIRVFGSVANGTADERSDVDFLVDMEEGRSLFDLGGLLLDLQNLLHRKVDVVTEKGLHWYIRDRILKEARPL